MANKQNPLLAKYEAIWEARYTARLREALRIGEDANLISADEVFGDITEEQAELLHQTYKDTVKKICKLLLDDSKDDPDLEWSTDNVDKRIRKIVGEKNFRPWNKRHGR